MRRPKKTIYFDLCIRAVSQPSQKSMITTTGKITLASVLIRASNIHNHMKTLVFVPFILRHLCAPFNPHFMYSSVFSLCRRSPMVGNMHCLNEIKSLTGRKLNATNDYEY